MLTPTKLKYRVEPACASCGGDLYSCDSGMGCGPKAQRADL